MESDILRQHCLALSPWPSKPPFKPDRRHGRAKCDTPTGFSWLKSTPISFSISIIIIIIISFVLFLFLFLTLYYRHHNHSWHFTISYLLFFFFLQKSTWQVHSMWTWVTQSHFSAMQQELITFQKMWIGSKMETKSGQIPWQKFISLSISQ